MNLINLAKQTTKHKVSSSSASAHLLHYKLRNHYTLIPIDLLSQDLTQWIVPVTVLLLTQSQELSPLINPNPTLYSLAYKTSIPLMESFSLLNNTFKKSNNLNSSCKAKTATLNRNQMWSVLGQYHAHIKTMSYREACSQSKMKPPTAVGGRVINL